MVVDIRLIAAVAERNDAKPSVAGPVNQATFHPLDWVGMRRAQGDAPIKIVPLDGVFLLFNLNENLASLVVLAGGALGLLAAFKLIELLLAQAVVARPVLGPLCVVMASVRS